MATIYSGKALSTSGQDVCRVSFGATVAGEYIAGTGIFPAGVYSGGVFTIRTSTQLKTVTTGTDPDGFGDVIVDLAVHTGMKAYKDAATAQSLTAKMHRCFEMADGSWLLTTGYEVKWNSALWNSATWDATTGYVADGGYGCGEVWRSIDEGATWTRVLTMKSGFVPQWGYLQNIRGNKVLLAEYENFEGNDNDDNARRVYLSEDCGATWDLIYNPGAYPTGLRQSHIHDVCWIDDTRFAIARGDANKRAVILCTLTGGTWVPTEIYDAQIVSLWYAAPYLYMGNDDATAGTITRINLTTLEPEVVLQMPYVTVTANYPPYTPWYSGSGCWSIMHSNGVFYARVDDYWNKANGPYKDANGIYASKDGKNWTCIYREPLTAADTEYGSGFIAGVWNGRIWWGETNNTGSRCMSTPITSAVTGTAIRYSGTESNSLTRAQGGDFGTGHGWTGFGGSTATPTRQATGGRNGGPCLKVIPAHDDGCGCQSAAITVDIGELVTISCYVKNGDNFADMFDLEQVFQTGTISSPDATTCVLSAGSSTNDIYNGKVIKIGDNYTVITDYVGSTKTVTVDSWIGGTPSDGATFDIYWVKPGTNQATYKAVPRMNLIFAEVDTTGTDGNHDRDVFLQSTTTSSYACYVGNGWHKMVTQVYIKDSPTGAGSGKIQIRRNAKVDSTFNLPRELSASEPFYVCDVQLIRSTQYYVNPPNCPAGYSGTTHGSKSEFALDCSAVDWAIGWVWHPYQSYRTAVASSTITLGKIVSDNGYLTVTWTQADNKINVTDGTTTVSTSGIFLYYLLDQYSFVIDGTAGTLVIKDPVNVSTSLALTGLIMPVAPDLFVGPDSGLLSSVKADVAGTSPVESGVQNFGGWW